MLETAKAEGVVRLPHHVQWTDPDRRYDLADRRDRVAVYELVLQRGLAEDVARFIDVGELIALWDELYLPDHVCEPWARWLRRHRGVDLSCSPRSSTASSTLSAGSPRPEGSRSPAGPR